MARFASRLRGQRGEVRGERGIKFMAGYRDLEVWKRAKALAVDVYRFTNKDPLKKDYGLVDQMRRSAVSIASNIAEGDERDSIKDAVRFLYIAKGSAAELCTQIEIAEQVYLLSSDVSVQLRAECDELARMLRGLIKHRTSPL